MQHKLKSLTNKKFRNYYNQQQQLMLSFPCFFILTHSYILDKGSQLFFNKFLKENNISNISLSYLKKKDNILKNINYLLVLPLVLFNKQFLNNLYAYSANNDIDFIYIKIPNYKNLINMQFLINFYKTKTIKYFYNNIIKILKLFSRNLINLLKKNKNNKELY